VPHFIVEYTSNIAAAADIGSLLRKASATLASQDGVFPLGGIRSRALLYNEYCVADGSAERGYVHATLKIGFGRTPAAKQRVCKELFEMLQEHFGPARTPQPPLLSMELYEFDEGGTYRLNNLHSRFRRPGPK
jgi:5-carboxymethyl-2-hydroxymuconate isomerase